MAGIGADCGTFNLVTGRRNPDTDKIECVKEVNAFFEMPLESSFSFNMMKKAGVPLIERPGKAYALGQKAVEIAYSFPGAELRRPMSSGCLNPKEKEAFQILSVMLHSLIGEVDHDGEVLCYTVPGNAINQETDVDYHADVLRQIFSKYEVNGKRVTPQPINEALAIVYAELEHKFYTGIGISFGSGMSNLCYAKTGKNVFEFSLVNSGDWIDRQAAKALGETATFVNKAKMDIDLSKPATSDVERAIKTQYRLLIRKTMKGIKDGLEAAAPRDLADTPIDIIVAGGTASPNGFVECAREAIDEVGGFPIEISEIRKAKDHLFTVCRGAVIAAEAAEES